MWLSNKNFGILCVLSLCCITLAKHLKKKSSATKKNTTPVPSKKESSVAPQLRKQLQAFFKLEDEVEKHLSPQQKKQMQITKSQVRLKAAQLLERLKVKNSTAVKSVNDTAQTAGILSHVVTGLIAGSVTQKQQGMTQLFKAKNNTFANAVGAANSSALFVGKTPAKVSNFTTPGKVLKEDAAYWKSLAQNFETMAHELQLELKEEREKSKHDMIGLESQNAQLRQQVMYFYSQQSREDERDEDEDPDDLDDDEEEQEVDGPKRDDEEAMQEAYDERMARQMLPMRDARAGYSTPLEQPGYISPQMRNAVAKQVVAKQPVAKQDLAKQPSALKTPQYEQTVKTGDTLQKISVIHKPASL